MNKKTNDWLSILKSLACIHKQDKICKFWESQGLKLRPGGWYRGERRVMSHGVAEFAYKLNQAGEGFPF